MNQKKAYGNPPLSMQESTQAALLPASRCQKKVQEIRGAGDNTGKMRDRWSGKESELLSVIHPAVFFQPFLQTFHQLFLFQPLFQIVFHLLVLLYLFSVLWT